MLRALQWRRRRGEELEGEQEGNPDSRLRSSRFLPVPELRSVLLKKILRPSLINISKCPADELDMDSLLPPLLGSRAGTSVSPPRYPRLPPWTTPHTPTSPRTPPTIPVVPLHTAPVVPARPDVSCRQTAGSGGQLCAQSVSQLFIFFFREFSSHCPVCEGFAEWGRDCDCEWGGSDDGGSQAGRVDCDCRETGSDQSPMGAWEPPQPGATLLGCSTTCSF